MTAVILVIGGARHEIVWDLGEAGLRRQIQQWMTRGDVEPVMLADGTSMLINWRNVTTVQVREG